MRVSELQGRDRLIVACMCRGLNDDQISEEIGFCPSVVRRTISRIVEKCGFKNRVELAVEYTKEVYASDTTVRG